MTMEDVILPIILYREPERDDNCRNCKALDENGETKMFNPGIGMVEIYKGHHSSCPMGCPIYTIMMIMERLKWAWIAKLCVSFHDHMYYWKAYDRTI